MTSIVGQCEICREDRELLITCICVECSEKKKKKK